MAMSQDHKNALAEGRTQSRAIKAYLNAIQDKKPGRPVTRESLEARLATIDANLNGTNDPLKSVELIQSKLEIEERLSQVDEGQDLAELEKGFIEAARAYSERKGISYTAWRQFGVPAATLRTAGLKETRRR